MSGLPYDIPPTLMFFIFAIVVIFVLWLAREAIFMLLKIVLHGIWVFLGGRPRSAPDRWKSSPREGKGKGGMFWSTIFFVACIITLLFFIMIPFLTFLKYGLIIAIIAFLFAGMVHILNKRADRIVGDREEKPCRERSIKNDIDDKTDIGHKGIECSYCSGQIKDSFYTCFYCGAIFCNNENCIQQRRNSGNCIICGRPLKTVYHIPYT